jgi:hypothetical protein
MKKKRGRPPGKAYPEPVSAIQGLWIAGYGKLGASEAMLVVQLCPHRDIEKIERIPLEKRNRWHKQILRNARRYLQKWNREIGTIVGQRIVAGDHDFFRQLADVVEKFSSSDQRIRKDHRSLATSHKLDCDADGEPFTLKGLRDYYKRNGHRIDSSTLSKMYRWARSAPDLQIRRTLEPLYIKRQKNDILKP